MNKKSFLGLSMLAITGITSASIAGLYKTDVALSASGLRPIDNPYTFVIDSANGDFARNYHLDEYDTKCITKETSLGNPIDFSYNGNVNEITGCLEPELLTHEYEEDGKRIQESWYYIEIGNYCDHLEDGTVIGVFNNITSITVEFTGGPLYLCAGTYTYDMSTQSDYYRTYNFDVNNDEKQLTSGETFEFPEEKGFQNYFYIMSENEENISISKITFTYLCN